MIARDAFSFNLGMVNAFCEMVEQGVKRLALSPPIESELIPDFLPCAKEIAANFGVTCYADSNFLETELASRAELENKTVILLYRDQSVLQEYLHIKSSASCTPQATTLLRKLLGYPN